MSDTFKSTDSHPSDAKIHRPNPTPKTPRITERQPNREIFEAALAIGLTPLQAKLVGQRLQPSDLPPGILADEVRKLVFPKLQYLQHPKELKNADTAARLIADAVESNGQIVLATDYDTDGVTSAWVASHALIDYFGVPAHRLEHVISERREGYGITDEVVDRILAIEAPIDLVISADQGSSDEARIQRLANQGIPVCVTDHHQIPLEGTPASAICTVNPQQPGCQYDQTVAGCFVIFLVMTQVRQELIRRGRIPKDSPSLKSLTSNVALGTVADSVSLKSLNNRAVVLSGLADINGLNQPAWQALRQMHDNQGQAFNAEYLGFQVATRINAASRVSDVTTAFKFLNATSLAEASRHLKQLDEDNLERRQQQEIMLAQARQQAEQLYHEAKFTLCIQMQGNAGIQGIIASRIGDAFGLPTIAMTDLQDGYLAGSGRGIVPDIDLREAFQWMAEQHSGLFESMGGHKGAAGCMIAIEKYAVFSELFEEAIRCQLKGQAPIPTLDTDGTLTDAQLTPALIQELSQLEPYGREWPKPIFQGTFTLIESRCVGQTQTHLAVKLQGESGAVFSGIYFHAKSSADTPDPFQPPQKVLCVYQPDLNTFHGRTRLQLKIVTLQPG
ncbi:MAG: single-stranded-DNA-specific exonuclease RecJ [Hydrogenovibrio sp.]